MSELIVENNHFCLRRKFRFFFCRIFLLFLSILSLYCSRLYGTEEIHFSKIGIREGLSQLSVTAIFQDELGNMWFATREGLNCYNGH